MPHGFAASNGPSAGVGLCRSISSMNSRPGSPVRQAAAMETQSCRAGPGRQAGAGVDQRPRFVPPERLAKRVG
jgi:hypothetical protein